MWVWFFEHSLDRCSEAMQYYYLLTVGLLVRSLEKQWLFKF